MNVKMCRLCEIFRQALCYKTQYGLQAMLCAEPNVGQRTRFCQMCCVSSSKYSSTDARKVKRAAVLFSTKNITWKNVRCTALLRQVKVRRNFRKSSKAKIGSSITSEQVIVSSQNNMMGCRWGRRSTSLSFKYEITEGIFPYSNNEMNEFKSVHVSEVV